MSDFKEHKELLYCGKCPFLKITPETTDGYDDEHTGFSTWKVHQQNECGVDEYYFGEGGTGWETLEEGENPKRKKGCLVLAEHIYSQIVKGK